ncbi:caspase-10-like [Myotis lucifugus]|uniref:caspase-10-like n=1 Tax=Myotis lucifugus TaxID=59463 RepID=UPI000CCBF601|nr:caspase-10-like [Myotis lucifugus]
MSSRNQSWISGLEDNGREELRRRLLRIDSNLGDLEVQKLKFLCRDLIPNGKLEASSALDIFDHLINEELLSEEDTFLLAELLYIMKQNSLLRHLGYTKEQVKGLLLTRKQVSSFRNLLYELSEDIDSENLKGMIFMMKDFLPKVEMLTSLSFLEHLEKQAKIDADDVTLLENLCNTVAPHLMRTIEKYKREKKEAEQKEKELLSASDINQIRQALPETSSEETVYRMDRKHRGYCVVINNQNFTSLSKRQGTDKDAECLKHVFQWLGFNVDMRVDVTKKCLDEVLQEYKSHPDHANGDCFVFCVLSHGQFGAVYSSDEALIPIREITSHFTARQCPGLANKPKLFFIQACQGEEIQPSVSVEADAVKPESGKSSRQANIPEEVDFLLGLATVPGYVSFRHKTEGSWYIQSLYNYLKKLVPRHEDILSILTAVNNDVSQRGETEKQIPQPSYTLRKKVIFPVPLQELPERVSTDS